LKISNQVIPKTKVTRVKKLHETNNTNLDVLKRGETVPPRRQLLRGKLHSSTGSTASSPSAIPLSHTEREDNFWESTETNPRRVSGIPDNTDTDKQPFVSPSVDRNIELHHNRFVSD